MIVSDNTIILAEGVGSFFKNSGRISAKAGKKLANNVLKNPGRAREITSNIATAAIYSFIIYHNPILICQREV